MRTLEAKIVRLYGLMCMQYEHNCKGCPLHENKECNETCSEFVARDSMRVIELIEDYAKENNMPSRQKNFLELFPNASIDMYGKGYIDIKPCLIDSRIKSRMCNDTENCERCKEIYWLE